MPYWAGLAQWTPLLLDYSDYTKYIDKYLKYKHYDEVSLTTKYGAELVSFQPTQRYLYKGFKLETFQNFPHNQTIESPH